MDIDGEPIAVQRIELVGEGTDTEGRGSICGEHSRKGQSRTARFSYAFASRTTNSGWSRSMATSAPCSDMVYPGLAVSITYARAFER